MRVEPGTKLLHYRFVDKIGEGGMGVVWRAVDTTLDREVAIKLLPEAFAADRERLARFEREAKMLALLNHPGIVTIHAVEHAPEGPFLVMEYVRGSSLHELIPPEGFPVERFFECAVALTEAVAAAHGQGVTHRDLKPGNVVVTDDGRLKVLDFGLAKLAAMPGSSAAGEDPDATRTGSATTPGVLLGTVAYMSPEQAEGRPADARSDIFSLGVMLFEMATGCRPFRGENPAQLVSSILRDPAPALDALRPDLPRPLGRVVHQCLEKDPPRRFQTALDVRNQLRALHDGQRLGARPSRHVALGVAAAVLLTVVAATVILFQQRALRDAAAESAAAGSVSPFVARKLSQLTFGVEPEQWPAWSPDGRHLVYAAEHDGNAKLFLKTHDGGEERQLTRGARDDIQPAWSPDGKTVAFVRASSARGKLEPANVLSGEYDGGDVWLIDVESGQETRIIEAAFDPAFSPDGARIAVDASWAGPRRIWITDGRGRNPRQVTTDTSEAVVHTRPTWSPDGTHLAFQHEEKTKLDLSVADVATGATARVTDDLYGDLDPVWSAVDGHIYFSSYRGGGWNIWRIAVEPDGRPKGPPLQLTTGAGQDIQPTLTADGRRVGFTVLSQNADLWRLPVDPDAGRVAGSPEPLVVSSREDSRGSWSPDGRAVAFNSDRDGEMNVWIQSVADRTTRPLTRGAGGDYQPRWSPDGKSIAFFSARSGNADIWVVDVATSALRQVTDHPALDTNPFFSADGKSIAFQSDRDGRKEVWIVDAAGGEPRQLTTVGAADHFLRWSDDDRWIYFRSTTLPDNGVCRVPAAGGDVEPLGIPVGWHMSFSPDRTRLLDVVGHKTMWIHPLNGSEPLELFASDDPAVRIDYPEWSPDGRWIVFDRVAPQGGDVWLLEGLR